MHQFSSDVLDDLSIRFIIPSKDFILLVPEEYFFTLEEAYWFAIDFFSLPEVPLQVFAEKILLHNGIHINAEHDYVAFKAYKQTIKSYGTMIFSPGFTHCLLVEQKGSSNSITFPKGKKSKNESGMECAIRETREEVGLDVQHRIINISITIFDKITLYLAVNVSMDIPLQTHTRNEIENIFWFDIKKIPLVKNKRNYKLFLVAFSQAAKIINELKAHSFKFDMGKIDAAMERALLAKKNEV